MTGATDSTELTRRNREVARRGFGVAAVMLVLAFASVPLYRMFCQATGYGGTTQKAERPASTIVERVVSVRLDGNVAPGLDWTFGPVERTVDVKLGETRLVHFRATNLSSKAIVGTATFNVSPDLAGAYFNKLECFCFTEQRLEPGQSIDMPVSFFVDPAMAEDRDAGQVDVIVLSYTFFPVDKPKTAARPATGGPLAAAGRGT